MADTHTAAVMAHPEIFTIIPPQPKEKKPGQLPMEKIREYFEEVCS
jgi:hypothetical protein